MKNIYFSLLIAFIFLVATNCLAQMPYIYGYKVIYNASTPLGSVLFRYDYTTGYHDTLCTAPYFMGGDMHDGTNDPYNSRLIFVVKNGGIKSLRALDVNTLNAYDTVLNFYPWRFQYDALNNRVIYFKDQSFYALNLSNFHIDTICFVGNMGPDALDNWSAIFNPIAQQLLYVSDNNVPGGQFFYVVVDVDNGQIIDTTLNVTVNLPVFDIATGTYYGLGGNPTELRSFDPFTGNFQTIAILPSSFYGVPTLETAVFDSNNHLYIFPYSDQGGNMWCDAIDVTTGLVVYHQSFPEFNSSQILGAALPFIRIHNNMLTTVYSKSYQWFLNGNIIVGDTLQSISPTISGMYKCEVTNFNDENFFSNEVSYIVSGISQPDLTYKISISPNPFNNQLRITIDNNEPTQLNVYDITARKILQQTFTNTTSINTEQLSKGIYLYEVRNKSGVIKQGKVVKD